MHYKKLKNLINQIPEERASIELFDELYDNSLKSNKKVVFDVNRLYDLVQPTSLASLSNILSGLEDYGFLEKIIYIESPASGMAAEFNSIDDIPNTVHDIRTDEEIQVTPDNIKVSYRIIPAK